MLEVIFLGLLGLCFLTFASISDLKTTIVPNWLNFSLIIFALGFRFFYSLFASQQDFAFFYNGLIGLGIFFILGNLFYYARVFAGGDAKLMISLGAVLPFSYSSSRNFFLFAEFLILFFVAGAIYGLLWSLYFLFRDFFEVKKSFAKKVRQNKKIIFVLNLIGLSFMVLGLYFFALFLFGVFIFLIPYFYFFAKSVDETSLIVKTKPADLIEGDWLCKDFKSGKRIIRANWGGLNKRDIDWLIKNKKEVYIKRGIPFVPVFFFAFLLYLLLFFSGFNFLEIF